MLFWIKLKLFFTRVAIKIKLISPESVYYIGGSETLPPPLSAEEETNLLSQFYSDGKYVKHVLIERNLRLVVYIARKFENTGINIEDLNFLSIYTTRRRLRSIKTC